MRTQDVAALAAYALRVARQETLSKPWLLDDVAQECLLAGWQAVEKAQPRDPVGYAKRAMRNAAYDTVVRGRSTGSERPEGGAGSGLAKAEHLTPLVVDGEYGPMLVIDPPSQEAMLAQEGAEIVDLRESVREAVRMLPDPDRLYVYLRFWEGWTAAEIAQETGTTAEVVAQAWHRRIRPQLVTRLAVQ